MLAVPPPHNDEIDLFELFESLWRGKWLISAFVGISFLLGCSFLFTTTPSYESKIAFSVELKPPYYTSRKINYDFKEMFYSKSVFNVWKSENEKSELVYEDFGIEEIINGFTFAKDEQSLFAYIVEDKKRLSSTLIIKSKKLSVLNDFFKYVQFINNKLTSRYMLRIKNEIRVVENTSLEDKKNDKLTKLYTNRFLIFVESGSKVISFRAPTFPKKISPNTKLILGLSIVLGGMIGVVFVLINTHVRKRKESVSRV